MKQIKLLLGLILIVLPTIVFSQGFTAPAEGNAAVYFVRITKWGRENSFEYFHNSEFIGRAKGKNYMCFEYPAGEHLFWISNESKSFVKCNLKAGKTYIVLVNVFMGAWKYDATLEPIIAKDKDFQRIKNFVLSEKSSVTSQYTIDKITTSLNKTNFIGDIMDKYQNKWKGTDKVKIITDDMFIPQDQLK
ncbi:MAG: hypothetical protein WC140_06475 [Bacteroidales bacterium]